MSKTLGGSLLIKDGIKFDYCFIESIRCLIELCDKVAICYVESDDGTLDAIYENVINYKNNVQIIQRPLSEWEELKHLGKERLAYFTNLAIEQLDTDYVFNLQSDEILSPESYGYIRRAISEGGEGYLATRINLWKDPFHMLNVPHHRKPCSTQINRLTKTCYRAYDDSESIASPTSDKYLDKIKIWHYGFVRKKEVHPEKIRNMQQNIFLVDPDKKLEGMNDFEWDRWFSEDDLLPVTEEHPPLIREWIKTRP
jgi:hypothetical protein